MHIKHYGFYGTQITHASFKHMLMKTLVTVILATLLSFVASGQEQCLSAKSKLRGYFYAGTNIKDSDALGGFWQSPNKPRPLTDIPIKSNQLEIRVVESDTATFFSTGGTKWKGVTVLVINGTDSTVSFEAQDSRLNIVCLVFYKGKWEEMEYLPSSWCGNSYHNIFLGKKEYWRFTAPCYTGNTPAKLRFRMTTGNGKIIYSNEITASFNPKALKHEEGHEPEGIIDPYNN